jgi:hypothetical protein
MINEVDPMAPSLSWVFRLSRRVATKMKVANAHHPGNGERAAYKLAPASSAAEAAASTRGYTFEVRAIWDRMGDPAF